MNDKNLTIWRKNEAWSRAKGKVTGVGRSKIKVEPKVKSPLQGRSKIKADPKARLSMQGKLNIEIDPREKSSLQGRMKSKAEPSTQVDQDSVLT